MPDVEPDPRGVGFVSAGTPCLTVTFSHGRWWLQLTRPESEAAYLAFLPLHQQPVGPPEVRRFLPRSVGLTWSDLRALPGMPPACEARVGETVVHLHGQEGAEVTAELMQAEFSLWMGPDPRRGRRLA